MITLAATETIAGVAGNATSITYTIYGMELASNIETYKTLAQGQLSNSAGTLYTAPASTQTFIKSMHLVNSTAGAISGIKIFSKGTTAANQLTGSFSIPANGWAVYASDAWEVYDANGEVLQQGTVGATPAVLLKSAATAGIATTFLRTDDTIQAFDGVSPINIAAAAATGTNNFAARSDHTHTIGSGIVTRAMTNADEKAWSFIGTATGATTTVGPIITAATFRQFMIYYQITGYNGGTPVGRLLCGSASISTTALTNSFSLSEGVTAPTTGLGATAIPGVPLAVTLSNISRSGVIFIDGASGSIKTINIIGNEGTPSVATAPTLFRGASFFSDLGTNLNLLRFQLSVYDTLTAVALSAQTFTTGTYLTVYGRNTD